MIRSIRNLAMALILALVAIMPGVQTSAQDTNPQPYVDNGVPGFLMGDQFYTSYDFIVTMFTDVNDMWTNVFAASNQTYVQPKLVEVVTGTIATTNCPDGQGSFVIAGNPNEFVGAEPGLYCLFGGEFGTNGIVFTPVIYVSSTWMHQTFSPIQPDNYDFTFAYVVAHEMGHHVEHQLEYILSDGTFCCGLNSEQIELPADCLAGVWANTAYYKGILTDTDVEEGMAAAHLLGSDYPLPADTPGDHGTRQERVDAFMLGYNNGDAAMCMNTNLGW